MYIPMMYNAGDDLYTVLLQRGKTDAKINPTLVTGDVQISKDGGAFTNLTTLPTISPAGGAQIKITLSATETACKIGVIRFVDQTLPPEWEQQSLAFYTYGNTSAFNTENFDIETKIDIVDANADLILADTNEIQSKLPTNEIMGSSDKADYNDNITNIESLIGTPVAVDSSSATLTGMLLKIFDDNGGADFDATFDSLHSLQSLIVEGSPSNYIATSQTVTNGTVDSGSYVSTHLQDDTYFQLSPNGSPLDVDLTFNLSDASPISITIFGRYEAATGRYCNVYAYDYISSQWELISTALSRMNNTTSNQSYNYTLLSRHKDPSTENMKIRFLSDTGDNYDLYLDSVLIKGVVAGSTPEEIADAVYSKFKYTIYSGAIYVDTNNGTSGSDVGINGLSSKPVNNLADAITLATTIGIRTFILAPGSNITLTQSFMNWKFEGHDSTINLNGQDISSSTFLCINIIGSGLAASGSPTFRHCRLGNSTLPACSAIQCAFTGTITMGTVSGDYYFDACYSSIGIPSIIFAATSNLSLRHYSGDIEIQSMSTGSSMSLEGDGQIRLNANCTDGTIAIRGNFIITDNAGGLVTLSDNARIDVNQIRDAMKLAPATGTPAVGSVDAHLDTLVSDTNTIVTRVPNTIAVDASGVVESNLQEILGTVLTESTAGRIANNLSTFFDNNNVLTSKVVDDIDDVKSIIGTNIAETVTGRLATRFQQFFDDTACYPILSPDSASTQIARSGADGDTLETISDQIDGLQTDTISILTDTNEIQTKLPLNNIMGSSVKTDKDDEIDAILADTNEIQGKLPTNNIMGSSDKLNYNDDIAAILVDTNEMQGKLPTNNIMGSSDKDNHDGTIDSTFSNTIAILADTSETQSKLPTNNIMGSSDKDNHDTTIDLIYTDTNEIQSKLPTNNIMGSSDKNNHDLDIDSILADTNEILIDTNEIQTKLPTDNIMGSSVKTAKDDEIDAILVDTNDLQTNGVKLNTQGKIDVNVEADQALVDYDAATKTDVSTVESNIRGTDGDDLKSISDQLDGVQNDVNSIQNQTRFVGIVPTHMLIPDTGETMFRIVANFYDNDGNMEDPDSNELTVIYKNVAGTSKTAFFNDAGGVTPASVSTTFPGTYEMIRLSEGKYELYYKLPSTEDIDQWVAEFALKENTIILNFTRSTNVVEENPGLVTLADNSINKDIIAESMKERNVSSITAVSGSIYQDINNNIDTNETKIDIIDTNVDAILVDTNEMQGKLPMNNIMGSSVKTDKDSDIDSILVDTNEIQGKLPTNFIMGSSTQSDKDDEIDTILVDTNEIQSKLPTNNIMGSSVKTDKDGDIDSILTDTNEMQGKLPTNNIMGSSNKADYDGEIDAILVDTNEIQSKLPTNNIMGSSVKTDKDGEIDAILVDTNEIQSKLPTNEIMGSNDKADYNDNITNIESLIGIPVSLDSGSADIAGMLTKMADNNNGTSFDASTDSQREIRIKTDTLGDSVRLMPSIPDSIIIPDTGDYVFELSMSFYNSNGNMEDPDNVEMAIKLETVSGIVKTALYDDYTTLIAATASTTFSSYYKMVRLGTGRYRTYYKLPNSESLEQWLIHVVLEENTITLQYKFSINIIDSASATGAVVLQDTGTNKTIIAKALKEQDVSSYSDVSGSIYQDINNNIDDNESKIDIIDTNVDAILVDTNEIQSKLPTNNIMGSSDKADYNDDIAAILEDTNEIQSKLPTNNIMGSSNKADYDGEIDAILVDTNEIQSKLPTNEIMGSSDKADYNDNITNIESLIGTPVSLDSGSADIAGMLTKMADDNDGASFDASINSLRGLAESFSLKNKLSDSQTLNSGVIDSGSHINTHIRDNVYFRLSPLVSNPIDLELSFTAGSNQKAIKVLVIGRYQVSPVTNDKWVDIYMWNYQFLVWDKMTGAKSRFNPSSVDEIIQIYVNQYHINPSAPYDAKIKFVSNDDNVASDLFLDYVSFITQSDIAPTISGHESAEAIWQYKLDPVEDSDSAGQAVKINTYIFTGNIISVTDASNFRVSDAPPGGDGTVWENHVLIYKTANTGEAECVPIQSADSVGNITLKRPLFRVPNVVDQITILPESVINGLPDSVIDEITESNWGALRSAHANVGSFGEGIASVQGNIIGNVEGNIEGMIGSLDTQAKADVKAETDQSLTDYDVATKTDITTTESNIRGSDNDDLKGLSDQLDTLQDTINGISNVTRLTTAIPCYFQKPNISNKSILIQLALKDINGNMEDPDSNQMAIQVYNSSGTSRLGLLYKDESFAVSLDPGTGTFAAYKRCERNSIGIYSFYYRLESSAIDEELIFKFGWEEDSIALYEFRSSQIVDAANDIAYISANVEDIKDQTDKIRFDTSNRVISDAEAISSSTSAANQLEANISNLNATITSRSFHSAADAGTDAASKILTNPANTLITDSSGRVEVSGTKNTLDDLQDISISDILSGNIDGKTVEQVLEVILSYSQGKITKSGSNYIYHKQDNITPLFTNIASPTERTRS